MSENELARFDIHEHPEFTIARITGDDLPSPQEFAASHSQPQLYDLGSNIDQKVLDLSAERNRIDDEIRRMNRARALVNASIPLAQEKGIE